MKLPEMYLMRRVMVGAAGFANGSGAIVLDLGNFSLFTSVFFLMENKNDPGGLKFNMSAYTNGRGSQIISFTGMPSSANSDTFDHIPSLPQIGNELEAYFSVARQIEAALVQERANLRKTKEELQELQLKHTRFTSETESRIRDYVGREERLHSQIGIYKKTEEELREQMRVLSKQIESLREENKKVEFNSALLQANIAYYKEREVSFMDYPVIRDELKKYKTAWAKIAEIDRKAKQAIEETEITKRKVDELGGAVKNERRRNASLEQLIAKEKREKQVALSCLHAAEARASQLTREIEELRARLERTVEDKGLELNF